VERALIDSMIIVENDEFADLIKYSKYLINFSNDCDVTIFRCIHFSPL
jgi:hypothetical protein